MRRAKRRVEKKHDARRRHEFRWAYVHARGCVVCDPEVRQEMIADYQLFSKRGAAQTRRENERLLSLRGMGFTECLIEGLLGLKDER